MEKEPIPWVGHHFNKHASKNPIYKLLVNNYRRVLQGIIKDLNFDSILEIGSGEGFIISYILQVADPTLVIASDIDVRLMKESGIVTGPAIHLVCRGENLPFISKTFDLVVACEVLEHTYQPKAMMEEARRVGKNWLVASVPNEPWWRILNMLRLKYLRDFGNTPGHIQHWNLLGFANFISQYIDIVGVRSAFPWTFIVGKFN